jgi:hypothetical protein
MVVLIALAGAARVLAEAGQMIVAVKLLGATAALRERAGPSLWTFARPAFERADGRPWGTRSWPRPGRRARA